MSDKWLLIDAPNLIYRAFYTTGGLECGATFGFLTAVQTLQEQHGTRRFVFCFDYGRSRRAKACPHYKSARRASSDEPERLALREEMDLLREDWLQRLGYRNVLWQEGYEADDLIAAAIEALPPSDEAVVVSSDQDLYQLLGPRVVMWKPAVKRFYTEKNLAADYYGLSPQQWPQVKAIAGCSSDSLPGVRGVGDVIAAKFLRGLLAENSKRYKSIIEGEAVWKANLPLVRLPYEGTKAPELRKDEWSVNKWNRVVCALGMKSLVRV